MPFFVRAYCVCVGVPHPIRFVYALVYALYMIPRLSRLPLA